MMIGISFVVWQYCDGIFSNVSMELPKFSMVSRELGNTVNALAIDGIFFRTAVTAIFVRRWRYYFPICYFSHVFMATFCKSDGIIENTGTVNKYCRGYQGWVYLPWVGGMVRWTRPPQLFTYASIPQASPWRSPLRDSFALRRGWSLWLHHNNILTSLVVQAFFFFSNCRISRHGRIKANWIHHSKTWWLRCCISAGQVQ